MIKACGRTLETVTSFKYLGQILRDLDDDRLAVVRNLRKSQKSWASLLRIMEGEGASPSVLDILFKVVVQAVLSWGKENWVMNPRMGRSLVFFQKTGLRNGFQGGSPWRYCTGYGTTLR